MEHEYIAFISYRHAEVDTAAAVQIQHLIEHYKIPVALRKDGNSHLGKVFRDTDELNVSSDLSESLCTALDHSAYLLVLCSPKYKESEWCRREIIYFLKHHDIEHVLPILVDGDPATAFPEELFRRNIVDGEVVLTEPLAANIASDSIRGMKQNLSREYLRIVSRMLDCGYDDLVQRQKRYERRRRLIGLGTAFSVLLAFIIMLLMKNAEINARYLESQRNQARYLSKVSLEQYAEGDRRSALASALQVLPEEGASGPVVPEQMYALTNGVNAYQTAYVPSDTLDLPDGFFHCLSEDGKYLFVYSSDVLQVVDVETKEICYSYRPTVFIREHPELEGMVMDLSIGQVLPEGKTGFFIQSGKHILHLDVADPSVVECQTLPFVSKEIAYTNGKLAVAGIDGDVLVIDWASGEYIAEHDFNSNSGETQIIYEIKDLDWNEDASSLAVALDYSCTEIANSFHADPEKNKAEEVFFKEHIPMGLILLEPASGQITTIASDRTTSLSFEGGAVGALHMKYPTAVVKSTDLFADPVKQLHASVYDTESGEPIYVGDSFTGLDGNTFGFSEKRARMNGETKEVYLLWLGKTAVVLDADTRELLYLNTFHADLVAMTSYKDTLVDLILSNGSIQHMYIDSDDNLRVTIMNLDVTVQNAWILDETYYIQTADRLIRCTNQNWTDPGKIPIQDPYFASCTNVSIEYSSTDQNMLRLVKYCDDTYEKACKGLELYPVLSDELLFSYKTEDTDGQILGIFPSSDGGEIMLLEQTADQRIFLKEYQLSDGRELYQYDLAACDADAKEWIQEGGLTGSSMVGLTPDRKTLWAIGQKQVHTFDLSEETIAHTLIKRETGIDYSVMSRDGKYLVWIEPRSDEKTENGAYILCSENLDTKEVKETDLPIQKEQLTYGGSLLPGNDSRILCYTGGTDLFYFDAETSSFLTLEQEIYLRSGSKIAVLEGSNELLAVHDTKLTLYDLDTGEEKSHMDLAHPVNSLVTDRGTDRIAGIYSKSFTSENDDGWYLGGVELIYIDQDRQMYREASINIPVHTVGISPSGRELANISGGEMEYIPVLGFEELKEKAEELLQE